MAPEGYARLRRVAARLLADERPDHTLQPTALVLEVDEALRALLEVDAELAALVELRFFGRHSLPEIASLTGQSLSTVNRRWRLARAWLLEALGGAGAARWHA